MSAIPQESVTHIDPDDLNIKDSNHTKQLYTIGTLGIGYSDSDGESFDILQRLRTQAATTQGVYELFDPVDEWYFGRRKGT